MRNKYSDEKSRTGARRASKPAALLGALVAALIVAGLSGALPSIQRAFSLEPERLSQRQDAYASWSFEEYPEYYRVVGSAVVDVELEPGEARYEGLDSLGRTGRAVALVTYDMMREGSDREREDIHEIHPSGWGHNREVDIQMPGEKTCKVCRMTPALRVEIRERARRNGQRRKSGRTPSCRRPARLFPGAP